MGVCDLFNICARMDAHAGQAAWAQAAGTIAAFGWSVWLYRQSIRDRRQEAALRRETASRAAAAAVAFAADQLTALHTLVTSVRTMTGTLSAVTLERLAMAEEMLRAVPYVDAEDAEVTEIIVSTRSRVAQAARRSKEFNEALKEGDAGFATLIDLRRQFGVLETKASADAQRLRARFPPLKD